MIKTSVGISAILHNISVVLVSTIGGYKLDFDTENYDAKNSTKRAYCKDDNNCLTTFLKFRIHILLLGTLMLLIFALYSVLFFHPFVKSMALPTNGANLVSPSISSGDGDDRIEEAHMNSPPLIVPIRQFILDTIQFTDIRNVLISYDTKHIVPEERENHASTICDVSNHNTSMNSGVDGDCNEKEIVQEDLEPNAIQSKM